MLTIYKNTGALPKKLINKIIGHKKVSQEEVRVVGSVFEKSRR